MRSTLRFWFLMASGFILRLPLPSVATETPTCAVLTFRPGTGCTADEAKFISDRYAVLLSQLGTHTVLARSEMESILTVQKWNMSDFVSGTENAVEVGKMLSVQYVIFGTMGKVGTLYSMNATLVDIETGKVTASAVTDFEGRREDFVRGAPADNIKSLLVVKQTPKDWATLPSVAVQPSTQVAEIGEQPHVMKAPESMRIIVPQQSFYFTPMLGVSMLTGFIGAELQMSHISLNVGWIDGIAMGIKYYFRPHEHSWYLATCFDAYGENGRLIGVLAGYKWRWKNRCNLALGLGVGQDKEDSEFSEDDAEKTVTPTVDIAFGYSF